MLKCDKTFDNGTSINFDGKVWFSVVVGVRKFLGSRSFCSDLEFFSLMLRFNREVIEIIESICGNNDCFRQSYPTPIIMTDSIIVTLFSASKEGTKKR